jgi:hypothetical protein
MSGAPGHCVVRLWHLNLPLRNYAEVLSQQKVRVGVCLRHLYVLYTMSCKQEFD